MPVRRRETGAARRYRQMGIAAALSRPWDYPTACGELAALLRLGYADLPKAAQALVAGDVLLAFRLLPDMQTGYAVSAANGLLQAVEVSLPKQKKAQAVSEFKSSVVTHKRRSRVQQEPGSPHIPHDVLVHIFSFLDMRSLIAASLVCWPWNSAANDNNLWKMNYFLFFGGCHMNCNSACVSGDVQNSDGFVNNSMHSVFADPDLNWKVVFHNKYAESTTWSFTSNRVFCAHCRSVIWLSSMTCAAPHRPKNGKDEVKLVPLLPCTVAAYICDAPDIAATSSDSDDSDNGSEDLEPRRFWVLS